jgi:rhomboid protease GluP
LMLDNVDSVAIFAGLLGGALLGWWLPPRHDQQPHAQTFGLRASIAVAAVAGLVVVGVAFAPRDGVDIRAQRNAIARAETAMKHFGEVMQSIVADSKAQDTGRFTARELDDRSRSVWAPKMRAVADELSALPPGLDKNRAELVRIATRAAKVSTEMFAMESNWVEGSDEPQPADPARSAELNAEFKRLTEQMRVAVEAAKQRR